LIVFLNITKPLRKVFLSRWFELGELRKYRRKSNRGSYQGSILLDHLRTQRRTPVIEEEAIRLDDYGYDSADIGTDKIVYDYYSSDSDYWY
jgi:hypothetical protein